MNYRIKVDVGQGRSLELSIYRNLDGFSILQGTQLYDGENCPANQVKLSCMSACPLRCGEAPAPICTMQCVSGCGCPNGMWMRQNGYCVQADQCDNQDKECPFNQVWNECGGCQMKCGDSPNMMCPKKCVVGCTCPQNMWMERNGECVMEDQCQDKWWDRDPCNKNPCRNGGTCAPQKPAYGLKEGPKMFICLCKEQYYGRYCEFHQINSDPC